MQVLCVYVQGIGLREWGKRLMDHHRSGGRGGKHHLVLRVS